MGTLRLGKRGSFLGCGDIVLHLELIEHGFHAIESRLRMEERIVLSWILRDTSQHGGPGQVELRRCGRFGCIL